MDREARLRTALVAMVGQYLTDRDALDSQSMSAGQLALATLAEEGLVEFDGARFGYWTEAGRRHWETW